MCSSLHICLSGSPVLMRSHISATSSGVYLLGLPVFGALETFSCAAAPLALALGFGAAVARFDGFAAVSGMTVVLVRVNEANITLKGVGTRCVCAVRRTHRAEYRTRSQHPLSQHGWGLTQAMCLLVAATSRGLPIPMRVGPIAGQPIRFLFAY